jgi:hypothetical protein
MGKFEEALTASCQSVRDSDAMDRFAPMGNPRMKREGTNDIMLALNGSTATQTVHQA